MVRTLQGGGGGTRQAGGSEGGRRSRGCNCLQNTLISPSCFLVRLVRERKSLFVASLVF